MHTTWGPPQPAAPAVLRRRCAPRAFAPVVRQRDDDHPATGPLEGPRSNQQSSRARVSAVRGGATKGEVP